jgi:excisionase family DNA binding protein
MENSVPFAIRLTCTIEEACAYTGLGRTKLYEEIGNGHIETITIGKRRLIQVGSLLRRLGLKPELSIHD